MLTPLLLLASTLALGTAAPPVVVPPNPLGLVHEHRLIVKFEDAARVRADAGRLVSRAAVPVTAAERLASADGATFRPLIAWTEARLAALQQRAEDASGRSSPDFAGFVVVELPAATAADLERLGNALAALPIVERAYIETIGDPPPVDLAPETPVLIDEQQYRMPDPGLDHRALRNMGLRGAGLRLGDVETNWNGGHEEWGPDTLHFEPGQTPVAVENNHGTAVLGVTSAPDNGYGITGAVPDAYVHIYPQETIEGGWRRVEAILAAIEASDPGDVIMLEIQTTGPTGTLVPGEWEFAVWQATRTGSDAGVVLVAAAGNGNTDLDAPEFAEYNARGDSGAIIVGAGNSTPTHAKLDFSTYGTRVDVQGWGHNVFTLGYGDYALYGGDFDQAYTAIFSGTSSATPTVTSVVVAIEELAKLQTGAPMSGEAIRELLIATGVPQGAGGDIGPLPNGRAAAAGLLTREADAPVLEIVEPVDGTVIDADSYTVDLRIEAEDESLLVDTVQISINGVLLPDVDPEQPYAFEEVVFPKGAFEIVAQGADLWGNVGTSTPVTIYVGVEPPEMEAMSTGAADETGDGEGASTSGGGTTGVAESPSSSSASTAEESTGDAMETEAGDEGCGCRHGDAPWSAAWWLAGLWVPLRARRRRS